jgi:hypothetical protein
MQSFQKLQSGLVQYLCNGLGPECECAKNKEEKREEEMKKVM